MMIIDRSAVQSIKQIGFLVSGLYSVVIITLSCTVYEILPLISRIREFVLISQELTRNRFEPGKEVKWMSWPCHARRRWKRGRCPRIRARKWSRRTQRT